MAMEDKMANESFPDEVVIEILSWLPSKSLLRFRCVNKTWFKLLTKDTHFSNLHLARSIGSNRNPSILALKKQKFRDVNSNFYSAKDFTTCDEAIQLELPFHGDGGGYTNYIICGTCNGLILLCLQVFKEKPEKVYLWNPHATSDDYVVIQNSTPPCLIPFSDRPMTTAFSLGFHQATNLYKIFRFVTVVTNFETTVTCVSLYTLGSDSKWRILDDNCQYRALSSGNPVALVNGALHWLLYKITSTSIPKIKVLVSFDLKDEVFQEITYPSDACISLSEGDMTVGELGGSLCLISNKCVDVQIWVMKEYGAVNSWTKKFKIGQPEICGWFYTLEPLCLAHSGEIIIKKNEFRLNQLIIYNPETNSIWNLKNFGFEIYNAYAYVRSHISPRAIAGVRHTMTT